MVGGGMMQMKKEDKIKLIAETLEIDLEQTSLSEETPLVSLKEWDSIGIISVMAMMDREFGKEITAEQIAKLDTIGDILGLME